MTEIEEGAEWSAAFSSGMQAATAILQAFGPNAYLVMPHDLYHGVRTLVTSVFKDWGLKYVEVDMTDNLEVARTLNVVFQDKTTSRVLLWLETPSNPLLKVTRFPDILSTARTLSASHRRDFISVLDTTWLTPYLLQSLSLGVDLTLNSATKFLGGHSDLLAGVVTGKRCKPLVRGGCDMLELEVPIRHLQRTAGGVLSPFDAWLLLRGLKTLPCRMRTHCANANQLATFFSMHPSILHVHFPGLPSHPGYGEMTEMLVRPGMYGSMLSIQVEGGEAGALKVLARLKVFRRATSLGSTESLCEHRRSVEGPLSKTPPDLIRISVGLEAYEDLEEDWRQALRG